MKRLLLPLVVAIAAGACEVIDPEIETQLGTLFLGTQPAASIIPDSVRAGEPFVLDLRTFGNSCVSFGRTEIQYKTSLVEIRPFDRVDTEGPCQDLLKTIGHPVTLSLARRETTTIRVIAMRQPGGQRDTLEKQVLVR